MPDIDKVILGDNQFFGVNHLSEQRGMETREKFKDIEEIRKIMHVAMDYGATGVFFSTHPDIYQITEMMRNDEKIKNHFNIYVNVPYIMKYVSMFNTLGPMGTIEHVLGGTGATQKLKLFSQGIGHMVSMDAMGIFNQLVDVELLPFRGLKIKAVLLHNALCDLALGYQLPHVIQSFDQHIRQTTDAIPGYGTQNYPAFCELLKKAELKNVFVMTIFNKLGFSMNPSREAYEQALKKYDNTVLAMATLASGKLKPQEAYQYLGAVGVNNVCVGLSSRKHAEETFSAIQAYI